MNFLKVWALLNCLFMIVCLIGMLACYDPRMNVVLGYVEWMNVFVGGLVFSGLNLLVSGCLALSHSHSV